MPFVSEFISTLRDSKGKKITQLLWGDTVEVLGTGPNGTKKCVVRCQEGFLPSDHIGDEELLEIYIIDVGQGDGILFKTPDGKWHVIDGGKPRGEDGLSKNAVNFMMWKFSKELKIPVEIETAIASHSDLDHYGGLTDLMNVDDITIEKFFHCGVARYAAAPKLGKKEKGKVAPFPNGSNGIGRSGSFLVDLLTGKTSFRNPSRPFAATFAAFAERVGKVPKTVRRLDASDGHLDGYGPGNASGVDIAVLSPIVEDFGAGKGLRSLGGDALTSNGQSICLRLDMGKARILLTGDLNTKSQKILLSYVDAAEFQVDVAKACHHGAEDVHYPFVGAMGARATVVSSGDNETFAHPRPVLLGASAFLGRAGVTEDGDPMPPLLYSTGSLDSARRHNAGICGSRRVWARQSQEVSSGRRGDRPEVLESETQEHHSLSGGNRPGVWPGERSHGWHPHSHRHDGRVRVGLRRQGLEGRGESATRAVSWCWPVSRHDCGKALPRFVAVVPDTGRDKVLILRHSMSR